MFDRWLNPVFVRETRQAVRNRTVSVLMQLYLLALVAYAYWRFFFNSISLQNISGEQLSNEYIAIAFIATATTVLRHTGGRLVAERINEDMMYVSTLRPMQIAMGKFWSGCVISFLFYTMTLPFLTLAYLFRGLDLRMMTVLLIASFLMIQTLNTMVLAFFAGVRNYLDAVVRTVPFLIVTGMLLSFCWIMGTFIFWHGVHGIVNGHIILCCFIYVLIPLAMLLLTACQFAPPQSNRMFSTRMVMTGFGLVTLGIAVAFSLLFADTFVLFWIFLGMYPFAFFALIATCERDDYGLRLRASIPKERWRRVLMFPLYSGDCNAIVWLFLWIIAAFLALAVSGSFFESRFTMFYPIFSIALFSFNYAVTAIAVRYCLRRWIAKESTWLICVALLALGTLCSVLFYIFVFEPNVVEQDLCESLFFVPNPFWIIEPGILEPAKEKEIQFMSACVWFLALLPFVSRWSQRRFKKFVRYECG